MKNLEELIRDNFNAGLGEQEIRVKVLADNHDSLDVEIDGAKYVVKGFGAQGVGQVEVEAMPLFEAPEEADEADEAVMTEATEVFEPQFPAYVGDGEPVTEAEYLANFVGEAPTNQE